MTAAAALLRLLDPSISLERAWNEMNSGAVTEGRAAVSTVEALMFGLRARGAKALDETHTRQRLTQLDDDQALEIAGRLQRLKREIAPAWSADEVQQLLELRETLNGIR
jgi:hypothetical protein